VEAEVILPQYHELTTMKRIVNSYPQWRHIVSAIRLRSIRLFSEEDRTSWYRYSRKIELRCGRAIASREREALVGSWIFKSGMYEREDILFSCRNGSGSHNWHPRGAVEDLVVEYHWDEGRDSAEMDGEDGYIMKVDLESELGYRVLG
jgi:hypothetical protein